MKSLVELFHNLYNNQRAAYMETPNPQIPGKFGNLTAWMPLLWLSLAFLAGILLASLVPLTVPTWSTLAGVLFVLFILLSIHSKRSPGRVSLLIVFAPALLAAAFLGAVRYQLTVPRVDAFHIAWYNDRNYQVVVTGTLTDPPDKRDMYTSLRVEVASVDTGDQILRVHGLILVRVPPGGDWHYGDVVRLRGYLKTPPKNEDFSYQDYLAHQGIRAYMPGAEATRLPFTGGMPILRLVYAFKEQSVAQVYRIFPDPEASLLAGILLGDDNGMSATLQQAYKNTGTAHIIAISGFNIAIIAGVFVALFGRLLGQRKGAVAAVIGILLYTVLVGATASVVRAAIMGGLAIFARQFGRRQNGLNTLAATAGVMVFFHPLTLWDVGFQLSFAATLGLILYAQPITDWFTGLLARRIPLETARKISGPVSAFLFFTLAAQVTTLPIMAYQFGRVSLVAVIANPLVLPVQPAVMILSGLAVLLSFIYLPLGQVAAWIAWPFAAYTNRVVEFFNRFPNGSISLGDFSFLLVVLFYAVLLVLTFAGAGVKKALRPALTPGVIIAVLGVPVYLVWSAFFHAPDGRLHVTFLDVGSAEAILIQTPSGRAILVNGGPSTSALASGLGPRLSAFDRGLDWLVVASPEEQQVAALPRTLDRFPAQDVLWAGNLNASYSAEALDQWLADSGTPVTYAAAGVRLDLGSGAWLEVLSVSPRGAILLVEWGGFRALLPMGMNFDVLAELENGKSVGTVTALLLADAGYGPSNPPEWVAALRPQVVILSVAAGDPNGMPDPKVLASLAGTTLLRTDRNGWITLTTDGSGMWVEVERR
jgi:competence protein ComEC